MTVSQIAITPPGTGPDGDLPPAGKWQRPGWWPWPAIPSDGPVTLRCGCGRTYSHNVPAGDLTAARNAAPGWGRDDAGNDRCPDCLPACIPLHDAATHGTRF